MRIYLPLLDVVWCFSPAVLINQGLLDGDCKVAAPGKTGRTSSLWLQEPRELSHSGSCPVLEPKQLGTEHAEVLIREGITV